MKIKLSSFLKIIYSSENLTKAFVHLEKLIPKYQNYSKIFMKEEKLRKAKTLLEVKVGGKEQKLWDMTY